MPTNELTRGVFDMPEYDFHVWLAANHKGIGGSTIGAILGVSSYGTIQSAWDDIMAVGPRSMDNNAMRRGRILEPHILDEYRAARGREVFRVPQLTDGTFPYFRATPDGGMYADERGGVENPGILEIKCLGTHTFAETRTHGIDPSYYAQLQWYLGVTGWQWGAFGVFNADLWSLYEFDVERDEPYIAHARERAQHFWETYVLTRTRPTTAEDDSEAATLALTPRAGASAAIRTDSEWVDAIAQLRNTVEGANLTKHALEQAQERVKELMGDDELVVGGGARVSYAASHRTSFDKDELQRQYPDLDLSRFERRTVTRTFRPTFDSASSTPRTPRGRR